MRCSLFLPADPLTGLRRSPGYALLENQAVAAGLGGLGTVWLADQWLSTPPRLPAALQLAQRLSVVTDCF